MMEAVVVPAQTKVHINGVPVFLAVDTMVECEYGNMALLTGHHYAHLVGPPAEKPSAASSAPSPSAL